MSHTVAVETFFVRIEYTLRSNCSLVQFPVLDIGTRGCHGNSIFRFSNSPSLHANGYQSHGPCGLHVGGLQLHVTASQRAKCAQSVEWHDDASHASATRGAMDGGQHSVVSGLDGGRLSALVRRVGSFVPAFVVPIRRKPRRMGQPRSWCRKHGPGPPSCWTALPWRSAARIFTS
jgi:hypothetical protein